MMKTQWLTCILVFAIVEHALSFQTQAFPTINTQRFSTVASIEKPAEGASFRQRMLRRLEKQDQIQKPRLKKDSIIQEARSLQDFKRVVVDEANGALVVVWFYAPWCRACKALAPGMMSLAKHFPSIKFVKVPALQENCNLHQGLGVPSVPFVHLYHPDGGLVEEQKLSRKILPGFVRILQDYQHGYCSLERTKDWSIDSPYGAAPKSKDFE